MIEKFPDSKNIVVRTREMKPGVSAIFDIRTLDTVVALHGRRATFQALQPYVVRPVLRGCRGAIGFVPGLEMTINALIVGLHGLYL